MRVLPLIHEMIPQFVAFQLVAFPRDWWKVEPRHDSEITSIDVWCKESVEGIVAVITDEEIIDSDEEMICDPLINEQLLILHDGYHADQWISKSFGRFCCVVVSEYFALPFHLLKEGEKIVARSRDIGVWRRRCLSFDGAG